MVCNHKNEKKRDNSLSLHTSHRAMIHKLPEICMAMPLPTRFTYPFCYEPDAICRQLAAEVRRYVQEQGEWENETSRGKMFGVMLVRKSDNTLGWLAAYSGNLGHSNNNSFFVPAIYDLLDKESEFAIGEARISAINHEIAKITNSREMEEAKRIYQTVCSENETRIALYKKEMEVAKAARDARRAAHTLNNCDEASLIRESQFQKAELKRMRIQATTEINRALESLTTLEQHIVNLKNERKRMSEALQQRLFDLYVVHNALGEAATLTKVFSTFRSGLTPPAGAGECAAPKMMEYAYRNNLKPLAMAEFWYGASPAGELRIDGNFYPACRSKCLPILTYMMKGLDVDANPLERQHGERIRIIYDDKNMSVIYKPVGMPSVPGKTDVESAMEQYKEIYPGTTGPVIVHRLDMSTSGLLIMAKDEHTYHKLQQMFATRCVEKQYLAILDGTIQNNKGEINLPMRPDYDDRPRQMVDPIDGKQARTTYEVIASENGCTRILLYPHTGRTHQLRVHCAHRDGLNCPIKGDMLYGTPSDRLYLQAKKISLTHPWTGKTLTIETDNDF